MITILPLQGLPQIEPGCDLAGLLAGAAAEAGLEEGDVLVVTQKVVSKWEGRLRPAEEKAEAVEAESIRVLRRSEDLVISETRHGLVCANAGVDESNVPAGTIALLPLDPDASARRLRSKIGHATGKDVAIVISDTFGRAWRLGQTDVAIGVAGIDPFLDHRGGRDSEGRILKATRICIADEIAGAAEMVMGKAEGICAALVKGAPVSPARGAATQIVRPPREDMFR